MTAHTRNAQRAFFAYDPALIVAGQVAYAGSRMGIWRPHKGIAMSDQQQDLSTRGPIPQQLLTQQPHYPPPAGSQLPPAQHRRRWASVWAWKKSFVAGTAKAMGRRVPHG
jgi:hypothetical protein